MKLGVVIPVYNERDLLPKLIDRLDHTPPPTTPDTTQGKTQGKTPGTSEPVGPIDRHLFVIDDGSTDGTREWIEVHLASRPDVTVKLCRPNAGKGAAIRQGFALALDSGCDLILIQDADLEYDPADHPAACAPILDGRADAVIGSRFIGQTHRVLYYWHSIANRGITTLSNMLSNLNLTDIECGTKVFSAQTLRQLNLTEDRFGIEPEIIAKLAKMSLPTEDKTPGTTRAARIYEVPVSYAGRTYAEGKKIGWRDGIEALRCIIQHNLLG